MSQAEGEQLKITVPSKKVQINDWDHELLEDFKKKEDKINEVVSIKIEGNSYSKDFCEKFGEKLKSTQKLKDLNMNDAFVARLKEQIPISIEYISKGLIGKNLIRLDISNNAVNPFGAKALLNYLEQAKSLEVLLISNCGLGPLGVAEVAKGLKGTPNLKTFSIGRNRMQNPGIESIAESIEFVPHLEELFIYQNTLKKEGLSKLFIQLLKHCKNLTSFDLCDNFVREEATTQMAEIIKNCLNLKNLNLSDCLNEGENEEIIEALESTENRNFERLGFNYVELEKELALRLLDIVKKCPMKRLEITGNDFSKSTKKKFSEAYADTNVLSKFEDDDDDDEEVTRLFEELKIE